MARNCACCSSASRLSRWQGRSLLAGLRRLLLGILWWLRGDGRVSCSAWRKRASAALTCIYPRAAQPVSSAGRARENPLIPWFSGAALHLALMWCDGCADDAEGDRPHPARSLGVVAALSLPDRARSCPLAENQGHPLVGAGDAPLRSLPARQEVGILWGSRILAHSGEAVATSLDGQTAQEDENTGCVR